MSIVQRYRIGLAATFLGVGVIVGEGIMAVARDQRAEPTVATVNGETIAYEDFLEQLLERYGQSLLTELIENRLIAQEAQRQGVTATAEEVDQKWAEFRRRMFPNDADYERWARKQGRRIPEIRERVRLQVLFEQLTRREVSVSEADVRAYYDQHQDEFQRPERVHGHNILLESEENAKEILKVLRSGEAQFADMARTFSQDPATKDHEGDMGVFGPDTYTEEINRVVFSLKVGEISDPVPVPSVGYYLFMVSEKFPPRLQTLEEVQDQIEARLLRERHEAKKATYLEELRKRATITILDERLR